MTQEDRDLLLKDLCSRLPYNCKVFYEYVDDLDKKTYGYSLTLNTWCINELHANKAIIKPYLRPMSSMTKEEKKEYYNLCDIAEGVHYEFGDLVMGFNNYDTVESIDYLNSIHIDYRGLIPKGLAIEVTEDKDPYKD